MKYSVIFSNTRPAGKFKDSVEAICSQDIDDYEVLMPEFEDLREEERMALSELQTKFSHLHLVPGKGNRSIAMNNAAQKAKGEYLVFIETHCIAPKHLLSTYSAQFDKGNVAVLGGVVSLAGSSPVSLFEKETKLQSRNNEGFWDSHNTAVRKDVFMEQGGFDGSLGYMSEFEYGARMHKSGVQIDKMQLAVIHHNEDDPCGYGETVRLQGESRVLIYNKHGRGFMNKYFPHRLAWIYDTPKSVLLPLKLLAQIGLRVTYAGHEIGVKRGLNGFAKYCFRYYAIGNVLLGMVNQRRKEKSKKNPLVQIKRMLFLTPSLPKQVDIEIATVCNLHCKMCKREEFDFGNQLMPYDKFTTIVDKLPSEVEMISFGGYGEMLMHPKFYDMVRYAKSKGFVTDTTSNGTLLNTDEKIKNLLNSGLDSLRFSIDHVRAPSGEDVGHVFNEKLLDNLKRVSELRSELGTKIELGINTVVQKGNIDELSEIVNYGEKLGFDLVIFIRLDTCMNKAERTLEFEKEKRAYEEIERMKKKIRVITSAHRFSGWKKLYHLRQKFCIFRYQSAHIRMNGEITPCAFGFATHNYGNIHDTTLKELWTKMEDIRKTDKHPTCQSCSIFKWGEL